MSVGLRIAVVGTSGSGKTTLARELAAALRVPFICNDSLLWLPSWTLRPKPEFCALLEAAIAQDAWTFDGNLRADRPTDRRVIDRATHLVWLDFPKHVVMRQLLLRTVRRAWTREVIFSDNRESFRLSFLSRDSILLWAWNAHAPYRRRYCDLFGQLQQHGGSPQTVRLRSPRAAAAWRSRFVASHRPIA